MTEELEFDGQGPAEPVRTGVDSVDRVIAAVAELGDRPVADHVAVFGMAHDQLRRALDAQPDTTPDP